MKYTVKGTSLGEYADFVVLIDGHVLRYCDSLQDVYTILRNYVGGLNRGDDDYDIMMAESNSAEELVCTLREKYPEEFV